MCRLLAYLGEPILAADLITRPTRSIIRQSFDARQRLGGDGGEVYEIGALNADGFGLGWYAQNPSKPASHHHNIHQSESSDESSCDDEDDYANGPSNAAVQHSDESVRPCVFTGVGPAWNNRNLNELARNTRSSTIFAHVRAAGPGMGVCDCSCHPFSYGRYLFMHNGQVGEFSKVRRQLLASVSEAGFNLAIRNSCTDSAVAFALFIDQLSHPLAPVSPGDLHQMVVRTIERICEACMEAGVTSTSLLNFVVTDGTSLVATRFVHSPVNKSPVATAASLYFSSGTDFVADSKNIPCNTDGDGVETETSSENAGCCASDDTESVNMDATGTYHVIHGDKRDRMVIVASEPITVSEADWVPVPNNHLLLVTPDRGVLLRPIVVPDNTADTLEKPSCTDVVANGSRRNSSSSDMSAREGAIRDFYRVLEMFGFDNQLPPVSRHLMRAEARLSTVFSSDISAQLQRHARAAGHNVSNNSSLSSMHKHMQQQQQSRGRANRDSLLFDDPNLYRVPSAGSQFSMEAMHAIAADPLQILSGTHRSAVLTAVVSGHILVTADGDIKSRICARDLSTYEILAMSDEQAGSVLALAVSQSARPVSLLSACSNNSITMWSMTDLHENRRFVSLRTFVVPPVGHVLSMVLDDEILFFGCQDANVRVANISNLTSSCLTSPAQSDSSSSSGFTSTSPTPTTPPPTYSPMTVSGTPNTIGGPSALRRNSSTHAVGADDAAFPRYVRSCSIRGGDAPGVVNALAEAQATPVKFGDVISPSFPCYNDDARAGTASSHCGYVYCVAAHERTWWCSGGGDGLIKLWSRDTLACVGTFTGHRGAVVALVADKDLFSASLDCTVRVWDVVARSCRRTIFCDSQVLSLAVCGSHLCAGTAKGKVHLWGRIDFTAVCEYDVGDVPVTCVLLHPARALLVCGTASGSVVVWRHPSLAVSSSTHAAPASYAVHPNGLPPPPPSNVPPEVLGSGGRQQEVDASETASTSTFADDEETHAWESERDMMETLRRFVALPTVSSEPELRESCWMGAKFTANLLERIGCKVKYAFGSIKEEKTGSSRLSRNSISTSACSGGSGSQRRRKSTTRHSTDGYEQYQSVTGASVGTGGGVQEGLPVVLGRIEANAPRGEEEEDEEVPTVTIYAHYDVVGATDANWETDPWKMVGRNGFLYGRGVTDNKGPLTAMVFAVWELHKRGELSCNVVFLVEGEEESGSGILERGFTHVVQDNLKWFEGTQAIIISNNYWIDDDTPCLTYGMRGVIDFEVCVKGGNKDLHAGVDGGPVFEPLVDLSYLLSLFWESGSSEGDGCLGAESGLAVPGLNDNVIGASAREKTDWAKHVPQDYARALERMGIGRMKTKDPVEILEWRWTRPSASVSSIATTNHAQAFRKIPHAVRARISLHFVPNQNSEHVLKCVREYLTQHFDRRRSGNEMIIRTKQVSEWWLGDTENRVFRVAEEAVREVWQKQPVLVREGGSFGGITAFLEGALKSPALHLPMGQSSDHAHLADERMRVHNLLQGKRVVKTFLSLFAPKSSSAE